MQRFPDHSAQPSEERVTYANHRRTGASLRLPMSASGPKTVVDRGATVLPIADQQRARAITATPGHCRRFILCRTLCSVDPPRRTEELLRLGWTDTHPDAEPVVKR